MYAKSASKLMSWLDHMVYIHTCINVGMHAKSTCKLMSWLDHMVRFIHTYVCTHIRTYIHTYMHKKSNRKLMSGLDHTVILIHTYIDLGVHARQCHMHTHKHVCVYIYVYIHAHTGAGLTHAVFMRDRAILMEISVLGLHHFRNLNSWRRNRETYVKLSQLGNPIDVVKLFKTVLEYVRKVDIEAY
jgi:hypothetical protein